LALCGSKPMNSTMASKLSSFFIFRSYLLSEHL
jgi:hypothetical protein